MGGSREGGIKARDKNLAKDPDFYHNIGKKSSENYMNLPPEERPPRGFAWMKLHNPKKHKQASSAGGKNKGTQDD